MPRTRVLKWNIQKGAKPASGQDLLVACLISKRMYGVKEIKGPDDANRTLDTPRRIWIPRFFSLLDRLALGYLEFRLGGWSRLMEYSIDRKGIGNCGLQCPITYRASAGF